MQRVDGQYVSTVTTDSKESNLGVQDVENIIDPMNWGVCSPFFDQMQQNAPKRNTKRWSRVKERVTAEPTEYCLETDLIFWKERRDGGIFINYDIDPERRDPGLVEVDNGYIWITPLPPADPKSPGVRIRTSKQERINGLSPCATAALACKMGWADMGRAMLADTARKNVNGTLVDKNGNPAQLKKFYTSCEEDPEEKG